MIAGIPFFVPLGGGRSDGEVTEEQLGRDVVVPVPVRICESCWEEVRGNRASALLRTGTLAFGIAAAVMFLLWFTEPILGFGVPISWAVSCFGGALVFWIVRHWYCSRSTIALKSLLQKTPVYRDLCDEYPDLEIVAGRVDEYSG
jgi:hypothetical protein